MELIAGRFLAGDEAPIDLATGQRVMLRQLPPCDQADERRWADACARLSRLWHEDMPPLLDHGFTPDGRFEAYGTLPANRRPRPRANEAVQAFLMSEVPDARCRMPDGGYDGGCSRGSPTEAVRLGMRLLPPSAVPPLLDILDDRRSGCPVNVVCTADRGAGGTTFLHMAAAEGRRRGYVPISIRVLERWPSLFTLLHDRTWFLLCDRSDSSHAAERWLLRLGTSSSRSHLLLRVGPPHAGAADVLLRLDPFPVDLLAASVHMHPAWGDETTLRRAAESSGGLPKVFLNQLRGKGDQPEILRVAEARAAYGRQEEPSESRLEHPWSDLIANAHRLWSQGRRMAAERDLRQIAGAARRRQMEGAAAAAEVELARLLGARGRLRMARDLLAGCAHACGAVDGLSLTAALTLADLHLQDGALESAESAYRVCRARDPERAGVGLARTLCWQGRYEEAEHAAAPACDSADPRVRVAGQVLLATVALGQHDLPGAARAAMQALSGADCHDETESAAAAARLLVSVHGRIGDWESAERYGHRALAAARSAGSTTALLAARSAMFEARHDCGGQPDLRGLERLVTIATRAPALLRAVVWAVAARAHPRKHARAEYEERVRSFVRVSGARALLTGSSEAAGAALVRDVTTLLAIHEEASGPRDTLERTAGWLRERLDARAVTVCDGAGAPLVRCGHADAIAAAGRVLTTRVTQPPWVSAEGLESAVVIRHSEMVRGVLACRWPLTRRVTSEAVPLMSAAASIVGPALAELAERAALRASSPDGIIGRSEVIERLKDLVARAAPSPFPVIVEGESGAGKELVARAIHQMSPRRLRACVAINCAALTEDLLEAELFGHARGAFTGAHAERAGLFEQADGGTLFLDEVSELSARAQAKLLRVLQDGEVRRLGENHARKVDVRVIAASNRVLREEVETGRFRSDLMFRLAVIRISVPPLRERPEDIPLLAAHYWESAAARAGSRAVLTADAVARLARHDWPGNVRELQNVIAALAVHVPRGPVSAAQVALLIENPDRSQPEEHAAEVTLEDARRGFERRFVAAALARAGGRYNVAARQLGISRQGLAKLLKRLELATKP